MYTLKDIVFYFLSIEAHTFGILVNEQSPKEIQNLGDNLRVILDDLGIDYTVSTLRCTSQVNVVIINRYITQMVQIASLI